MVKNSKIQLIEIYINNATTQLVTNAQTTINMDNNAKLNYTILQQANINDCQQLKVNINQKNNSQLDSQIFSYGGNKNQVILNSELIGEKASCCINALEYTKISQQQILNLNIKHLHPNTNSKTIVRSVVDGYSSCTMHGRIFVGKDINKINAKLQHKTILLSEQAKIDSKPELEIYNDDVVCSHGSTIGKLDPNALMYMNTRGISTNEARLLLLQSFIDPILTPIQCFIMQNNIKQLFLPGISYE